MAKDEVFFTFEEFLSRYFPQDDPDVVKAVLALAKLNDEQVETVIQRWRRLKHVKLAPWHTKT